MNAEPEDKPKAKWKLFVIGLPVVVVLLAVFAFPNFAMFGCRAKQSEAKMNLRALYVAEAAFFSVNGRYTEDTSEMGWELSSHRPRYAYEVSLTSDGWRATAEGLRDIEGDRWSVNMQGQLDHERDGCGFWE